MNYSAKCNIYEYSLATTWERFADRLSGSYGALFCVVSERPLPPQAQQALASSAKALGYGTEPCTFVTLCAGTAAQDEGGQDGGTQAEGTNLQAAGKPEAGQAEGAQAPDGLGAVPRDRGAKGAGADAGTLAAVDLFELIEGLDPNVLVAADAAAAQALSTAYRAEVPPGSTARLLGRSAVTFRSFEDQLANQNRKQKAWALLKRLPAFATLD